jgi:hypothetical protein
MAESHVTHALKEKATELKRRISKLKREIKEHQAELQAVYRTLNLFEPTLRTGGNRLFRRGELAKIALDAFRDNPEGLSVDELAAIVIEREGFDPNDKETVATIRQRCMMALDERSTKVRPI